VKPVWKCPYEIIPQFFHQGQRNCAFNQPLKPVADQCSIKHPEIFALFSRYPQQVMPWKDFAKSIVRPWLQYPIFMTKLVIQKMNRIFPRDLRVGASVTLSGEFIPYQVFVFFWEHEVAPYDPVERLFRLLYQCNQSEGKNVSGQVSADIAVPGVPSGVASSPASSDAAAAAVDSERVCDESECCIGLSADDFIPLIHEIIDIHPGLKEISVSQQHTLKQQQQQQLTIQSQQQTKGKQNVVLSASVTNAAKAAMQAIEDQELQTLQNKYMLYVITRIFYTLNHTRNGLISKREFRHYGGQQFLSILQGLSHIWDINEETMFFSLKHFQTLVYLFQQLDEESQDGILTRKELQKYDQFSLTPVLINR
jgi:hypothetical protein